MKKPNQATEQCRWLLLGALLLAAAGCEEGRQRRVVLYASADTHIVREVISRFQEQTSIRVDFAGDTEQVKTTGLANRLRAEKDNPQADVFWSSEVFQTILLAQDGVFAPHGSQATTDRPAFSHDPKHRWYGFAARARVIVYAPDRVAASDLPRTWMDLTNPLFKGRIVIADPRFGTTGGHLAAMKAYWSRAVTPAFYEAFLMGLADNEVRMLPGGNAGVVAAVVSGEADLGMTDTDDVWAAQARGLDVRLIYPRHGLEEVTGAGTLLIPNTVARVRGGPNPLTAALLIDFLLSETVERLLADSVSHNIPLGGSVADDYPHYAVPDPLAVDLRRAAELMGEAVRQAMRLLNRNDGRHAG